MTALAAGGERAGPRPLRILLSAGFWRAVGYLASYPVAGACLFATATAAVLAGAVLALFTFGLPLVVGTAWIVRGCAQVERGRAAILDEPVPYAYREVTDSGMAAHVRTRCTDPAFLRDCAALIPLFPVLLVLDLLALLTWLVPLAGLSLPLWYETLGAQAPLGAGTLPVALAVALISLPLSLLTPHAVVAGARLHLSVARAVLRPPADPLARAKNVLDRPGPLGTWEHSASHAPSSDRGLHERESGRTGR